MKRFFEKSVYCNHEFMISFMSKRLLFKLRCSKPSPTPNPTVARHLPLPWQQQCFAIFIYMWKMKKWWIIISSIVPLFLCSCYQRDPFLGAESSLLLSPILEPPAIELWLEFPGPASSSKCLLLSASSSATSAVCCSSSLSPLQ